MVAIAVVTVTALVGVAKVEAGGSATLAIGLVPGSVTAGQQALAVATFTNSGPSTLVQVLAKLTFSSPVSIDSAPGCLPRSGTATTLYCVLLNVKKGTSQQIVISYVPSVTGSLTLNGTATYAGWQRPLIQTVSASSQPAIVFAAGDPTNSSNCLASPQTLTATGNLTTSDGVGVQQTQLPNPPTVDPSLGLPCTPLAVGVGDVPSSGVADTNIAIVDVPQLSAPATVVLTFPDEALPNEGVPNTSQTTAAMTACSTSGLPAAPIISNLGGKTASNDNPNYLQELGPGESVSGEHTVCGCDTGPTIPAGQDSCITNVTSADDDNDFDAGTITLLVQGNGLGDPAYVG